MNIYSPLIPSSNDITVLKTVTIEELVSLWHKQFNIDISNEISGIDQIQLCVCNRTKLRFFLPLETSGSSKLYESLEKYDWYYMPTKWEHDVALEDLKGCSKVLEVGCGKGAFVKRLREQGFEAEGIEFNPKAVKYAQAEEIPVSSSSLQEILDSQAGQFDAVCTFQVLEHVSNPHEFIKNIIDLVRVGGKVVFGVPNANSFLKHQFNLLDMPPHHVTQWQLHTFQFLEKIFPLKIIKSSVEPLSMIHANGYFMSYCEAWAKRYPTSKILLNKYTLPVLIKPFRAAIRMGAGRFLVGQSLYVCFEKLP